EAPRGRLACQFRPSSAGRWERARKPEHRWDVYPQVTANRTTPQQVIKPQVKVRAQLVGELCGSPAGDHGPAPGGKVPMGTDHGISEPTRGAVNDAAVWMRSSASHSGCSRAAQLPGP